MGIRKFLCVHLCECRGVHLKAVITILVGFRVYL